MKKWKAQWRASCVKGHPRHSSKRFMTHAMATKALADLPERHGSPPMLQRRLVSSWKKPTALILLKGDRDGDTYDAELDFARLNAQQKRVYEAIKDGHWVTLYEIRSRTGDTVQSISARLRDFRKPRFGSHKVNRRRSKSRPGVWFYQLVWNDEIPRPRFDEDMEISA